MDSVARSLPRPGPDPRPVGRHPRRHRASGPSTFADLVARHRPAATRPRTGSRSRSRATASSCAIGPAASGSGRGSSAGARRRGAALALVEPAAAVLQRLSAETGESAQLYVREGDQRVCVATHERPTGLRDTVPLGAVMPLTKGSGGRVLLAWADDRDRFDVDAAVLADGADRGMGGDRRGARGRASPASAPRFGSASTWSRRSG